MEITYKISDFPEPGDRDLYEGIQEMNKENYSSAFKYFEKASNYDNEYATLFVAILYISGIGLPNRDPLKAIDLLKKIASECNNRVAQYIIGAMYFEGDENIPIDKLSASYWLSLSANNGWYNAMINVGHIHLERSTKEDKEKGLEYLEKAANCDDNETDKPYDKLKYIFGNKNFERDISRANKVVIEGVRKKSQGDFFSFSKYVKNTRNIIDYEFNEVVQTIFWDSLANDIKTAARLSQIHLYLIYVEENQRIPANKNKALYWAEKAGNNGHVPSCIFMGDSYDIEQGKRTNYKKAMEWYKKALEVEEGSEALSRLGLLYYGNNGVEKNWKTALTYFERSVQNRNNGESYFFMGEIHMPGKAGVPKNYKKAFEFS